jgi:hypothetical protein
VDEEIDMSTKQELTEIVTELSKALCCGRIRNSSLFLATGVSYPNGIGATVRIDSSRNGYFVSDDGYASFLAETMNAGHALNRIATGVASRSGVLFEKGTFLMEDVERGALHLAVSAVSNSSCRAMERLVASLEKPRMRRSREQFFKKLRAAFGDEISFELEYRGATGRNWVFDAGLSRGGHIVRLFELVSPTTQAVALANMKISDTVALHDAPRVTAVLSDYDGTEPALRSILSNAGSTVIAANDDVSKFRLAAA